MLAWANRDRLPSELAGSMTLHGSMSCVHIFAMFVSGGQARSGWASRIRRSSVEPERAPQRTITGSSSTSLRPAGSASRCAAFWLEMADRESDPAAVFFMTHPRLYRLAYRARAISPPVQERASQNSG
jgi:hypothetical protein